VPYANGKIPVPGDYVKNQFEQPGTVTRVHFVESHTATSGCAAFSDLRPAPCFLHAAKLGCTGRHNSKGNASH
jgi:hypothetical protein